MDEIEKALRSAATLLEALRLDNNVGQILGPQERRIYRAVEGELMKWYEEFERELERKQAEREREAQMFAKERGESVEAWRADVTADDPGLEPDGEEN